VKKKVVVTGSTGFMGRNVTPYLRKRYDISVPARTELDLLDADAVRRYLNRENFDAVIHLATPTGHNPLDKQDEIFERSLRVFMSLACCSDLYGGMIYIGSGAEYGKHRSIANVKEDVFGQELPQDSYGLSRYIMSEAAERHSNIYNLRLFGCYGAGDPPHKLIPYIIGRIRANKPMELKQNVLFDFLYVKDMVPVIEHFINNAPIHKAYNLTSGIQMLIGDIAAEVRRQMKSDVPMVFKQEGLGLEYTGNNERLRSEIPHWLPTSIETGISEILKDENRKL
jgi:GDP-L-fucose synthase